jgi:hypothetical protein
MIMVDFHMSQRGYLTALARFSDAPEELVLGGRVTAADFDGNRCDATIVALEDDELTLALDFGTFQGAGNSAVTYVS